MFRPKRPLTLDNLTKEQVPNDSGVYIVYTRHDGRPYYVGRSRVSMRARLMAHAQRRGSRKIREGLDRGWLFDFEWEAMISPEQAEAQLIERLGKVLAGNLRAETDPVDWLNI